MHFLCLMLIFTANLCSAFNGGKRETCVPNNCTVRPVQGDTFCSEFGFKGKFLAE